MAQLELRNIDFSYNRTGRDSFRLDKVSLSVEKGEFITIIGPNGSGKSTLLKIISGFLKPSYGSVFINDDSISSYSAAQLARKIAFVPQKNNFTFQYSISEVILMGRNPHLNFLGFENESDRKIVNDAIDLLGLTQLKNKGINEVSGGEAQRAFIARALAQQTEIILLDEPNSHLDIHHQLSIFDLLRKMNKDKELTVIAVSHDLNLSGHYSNRVIMMNEGRIFLDDKRNKVLTKENIQKVFNVNSIVDSTDGDSPVKVLIAPDLRNF